MFSARTISTAGDNLYIVAAMWLVFDLTGSTFFTGIAAFLSRAPGSLGFLAGPIVDRRNPRLILVATELVQMVIVLMVPVAALFGRPNVLVVLAVIFLLSASNQFSRPAQRVALPHVIDNDRMVEANSVFSLTHRGIQAASRATSGFLIGIVGSVAIYSINSVTYFFGALLFSSIYIPGGETGRPSSGGGRNRLARLRRYLRELSEGKTVVLRSVVLYIVLGSAIANFLNGVSMAVLPKFASSIAGAAAYGALYAGIGVGLFVGAMIASAFEDLSFGWLSVGLFLFAGSSWIGAVVVTSFNLTVSLFALAWVPIGVYNVLSLSLLQIGVPDDLLGRVVSISTSLSGLMAATGMILGGSIGEVRPSAWVMIAVGGGLLLVGLFWLLVPSARTVPSVSETETQAFQIVP